MYLKDCFYYKVSTVKLSAILKILALISRKLFRYYCVFMVWKFYDWNKTQHAIKSPYRLQ